MIAIIISACLMSDPNVCKDYRVPLDADIPLEKCAMYAPVHFAQWAEQHPGWRVVRWQCRSASITDL